MIDDNKETNNKENEKIVVIEDEDKNIEISYEDNFKSEEERKKFEEALQKKVEEFKKMAKPSKKQEILQNIMLTLYDFFINFLLFISFSFIFNWYDRNYSFSVDKLLTFISISGVYCLIIKIIMTIISNYFLGFWAKYGKILKPFVDVIVMCVSFMLLKVNPVSFGNLVVVFIIFEILGNILKLIFRRALIIRKLRIFK